MAASLRKSFTACEALAALPPTPRMNSRPPRSRTAASSSARRSMASLSRLSITALASARYCSVNGIARPQIAGGVLDTGRRADLVEALVDLVRGQLALREQLLVQPLQIARHPGNQRLDRVAAQQAQTVVDVAHCGGRPPLAVGRDLAAAKLDVGRIPAALVVVDGHQAKPAVGQENIMDGRVATRQQRVAVEHEKGVVQQRQRLLQSAGGTQQGGAVIREANGQAEAPPVTNERLDLLAQVAGANHHVADAFRAQQAELVRDERLAGELDQSLWAIFSQAAEPCRLASGEQRHGNHDWVTTCAPWKSNRKRTSGRPASSIARRSRTR